MADVKHDTKRSETQLIGEVRIAHPYHQEKRTKSAGGLPLDKPRNDAVLLVPKLDRDPTKCANYAKLSGMCMEAATKAWAGWPDGGKWPIQDGDIPHPHKPKPGEKALTPEQLKERNKWREGSWVVEVSSGLEPGPKVSLLTNGVLQDIPAQTVNGIELYKSGDYGYVSMSAYTFQNKTWGVNFGYEGVAYTRPGERIGGGPKSSQQMFGSLVGSVPGPAGGPPLPPTASPPLAPVAPGVQGGAAMPPLPPAGAHTAPSATATAPTVTAYAAPPSPPMPPGVAAGLPPIPGR